MLELIYGGGLRVGELELLRPVPRLFQQLPTRDFLRILTGLDHTGHCLQQPPRPLLMCRITELPHKHEAPPFRIVNDHRGPIPALEMQPSQDRAHLAVGTLVAKLDSLYFEKAVEDAIPRVDFNIFRIFRHRISLLKIHHIDRSITIYRKRALVSKIGQGRQVAT